jgi:hypothetical protein
MPGRDAVFCAKIDTIGPGPVRLSAVLSQRPVPGIVPARRAECGGF